MTLKQKKKRRGGPGRIRTLSSSEVSSKSGHTSNEEMVAAAAMDPSDDSMSESHDMIMIDEAHVSQESENLSSHSMVHEEVRALSEGDYQFEEENSWKKVTVRKHKLIELRDLTEDDFTSLIEAKN